MTRMPGSIGSVTWQGGSMATASSNELHQLHQFQGSRHQLPGSVPVSSFVQSAVRCQPSLVLLLGGLCGIAAVQALGCGQRLQKHAAINVRIVHWILDTYSAPWVHHSICNMKRTIYLRSNLQYVQLHQHHSRISLIAASADHRNVDSRTHCSKDLSPSPTCPLVVELLVLESSPTLSVDRISHPHHHAPPLL